jgi:CheY-like chemotaxis protein
LQQQRGVAFVFSDVNLAGTIDGLDLAAIIRERYPRTAVVITSSDRDRASKLPAGTQFMPKPWRPLELLVTAGRARAR